MKERKKTVYSYIRYPLSHGGWFSIAAAVLSFAATQFVAADTVLSGGDVSFFAAALGLSAIVLGIAAAIFAVSGLLEKEKNYILAVAGGAVSLVTLLEWIAIFTF